MKTPDPGLTAEQLEQWGRECQEWDEIKTELLKKRESVTAYQVTLEQRKRMLARGDKPLFNYVEEPEPMSKHKICYNITERGEKKYWTRIGVAFVNSDGSINVKLDSLPITGEFQIRDYAARDEAPNDAG